MLTQDQVTGIFPGSKVSPLPQAEEATWERTNAGAPALKLDFDIEQLQQDSTQGPPTKKKTQSSRCGNTNVWYRFHAAEEGGKERVKLAFGRCKQWSCAYCAKINASVLRTKLKRGVEFVFKEEVRKRPGFRAEYNVKFLTLTYPGGEFRDLVTCDEAESVMAKKFDRFKEQLRREVGSFEYVRIKEIKNGFPHYHVLLVGAAISGKDVKERIERIWRDVLGMGYVKLNVVKHGGVTGLARYVTKYMTKQLEAGAKGSRVYSMSRGIKAASEVGRPVVTVLEFGRYRVEDGKVILGEPIWRMSGHEILPSFLEEVEEIFDSHYQLPLFGP